MRDNAVLEFLFEKFTDEDWSNAFKFDEKNESLNTNEERINS